MRCEMLRIIKRLNLYWWFVIALWRDLVNNKRFSCWYGAPRYALRFFGRLWPLVDDADARRVLRTAQHEYRLQKLKETR
jgi:hypothetical protein